MHFVSNTPQFGRSDRPTDEGQAEQAGADEGGGAPVLTGRSLQAAFAQVDGSDAAAGPRHCPPQQKASASPLRQQTPQQPQAFSRPHAKQQPPPRSNTAKDRGTGSQSSRSNRGASSSKQGKGDSGPPTPVCSGSGPPTEHRLRSPKREASTVKADTPSRGDDDSTVMRLKQEVYAKDQEIVKLRAMCQEQASRLKQFESHSSSEVGALRQRMEEFEALLKAHGGTVLQPVSTTTEAAPSGSSVAAQPLLETAGSSKLAPGPPEVRPGPGSRAAPPVRKQSFQGTDALAAAAIQEIGHQLLDPSNDGRVWIENWSQTYSAALGPLREFLESQPDLFHVVPGPERTYTVQLVGHPPAGQLAGANQDVASAPNTVSSPAAGSTACPADSAPSPALPARKAAAGEASVVPVAKASNDTAQAKEVRQTSSKPRARSTDVADLRPHWATLAFERQGAMGQHPSPRQSVPTRTHWATTLLSPCNSLRSTQGSTAALDATLQRPASMSQVAPALHPCLAASACGCRSSRASLGSMPSSVRKAVAPFVGLTGPAASPSATRSRSPSNGPVVTALPPQGAPATFSAVPAACAAPHGFQDLSVYRYHRSSRATLPVASVVSGPSLPVWLDGSISAPPASQSASWNAAMLGGYSRSGAFPTG
eukprot:TRINITY_DN22738_c0_g2_i1.p1 TRINITY_DN22738_c0_g2~~TRINITY_DN22738_c0_g2_i1.p1  ORF type:complete len:671 (+),score=96.40 TRINITY_DN22738_c0_g2_i1:61-2013(+)